MTGWHWAASLRHEPLYVNIPYRPHRILVIGWGRLARDGTFRNHQPCAYRMRLLYCCPANQPKPAQTTPKPGQTTP